MLPSLLFSRTISLSDQNAPAARQTTAKITDITKRKIQNLIGSGVFKIKTMFMTLNGV